MVRSQRKWATATCQYTTAIRTTRSRGTACHQLGHSHGHSHADHRHGPTTARLQHGLLPAARRLLPFHLWQSREQPRARRPRHEPVQVGVVGNCRNFWTRGRELSVKDCTRYLLRDFMWRVGVSVKRWKKLVLVGRGVDCVRNLCLV